MFCNEVRARMLEHGTDDAAIATHLKHCEACRETVSGLENLQRAVNTWRDEPVPAWNRAAVGPMRPARPAWWQTYLPLAACAAMLLLVAFRLEFRSGPEGWSIGFGPQPVNQQLDQAAVQDLITDAIAISERRTAYQVQESFKQFREDSEAYSQMLIVDLARYTREDRAKEVSRLTENWSRQRERDLSMMENQIQSLIDLNQSNRKTLFQLADMVQRMPMGSPGKE